MGIKKENQHDKLLPPLHTDDCRKNLIRKKREKRVFIPMGIKNEKKYNHHKKLLPPLQKDDRRKKVNQW